MFRKSKTRRCAFRRPKKSNAQLHEELNFLNGLPGWNSSNSSEMGVSVAEKEQHGCRLEQMISPTTTTNDKVQPIEIIPQFVNPPEAKTIISPSMQELSIVPMIPTSNTNRLICEYIINQSDEFNKEKTIRFHAE